MKKERQRLFLQFMTLLQEKGLDAIFVCGKEYDKNLKQIFPAQKQYSTCAKLICIQHSAIACSQCQNECIFYIV